MMTVLGDPRYDWIFILTRFIFIPPFAGTPLTHSYRHSQVRRALSMLAAGVLAFTSVMVGPVAQVIPTATVSAAGSFADAHFADFTVWTGLTWPTTVRFAADGRAFVAEKGGVIKEFDSVDDTSPTKVLDIRDETSIRLTGIAGC